MNEIGPDVVNRCILSNVRESVDALIELAESESNSSALLALVKKTVKDEFYKAALKITEQINKLVQQYNNRECVIAGVSPEVKADRDENGCLDTGRTVWIDMHRIGIRRIGETGYNDDCNIVANSYYGELGAVSDKHKYPYRRKHKMRKPKSCNGCRTHFQSQWRHTCELGYEMQSEKIGSVKGVDICRYYPKNGQ